MRVNEENTVSSGSHKTLWIILSVIIAFLIWLTALMAAPGMTKVLRSVPIHVDIPSSMQLVAVSGDGILTTVVLDGKQYEIGNYTADDIRVTADLSSVTGPGSYEVPLLVSSSTTGYTVTSISPSTVQLIFEAKKTLELPIDIDINGLDIPADYISPEDEIRMEPEVVQLTGAESILSRVERAVVKVNINGQVSTSQVLSEAITYYDIDGNVVDVAGSRAVQTDVASVEVMIPVKRVVLLPLTLSFLNVPDGFPLQELSYELSTDMLKVAAEESVLRRYNEIVLGYIDLKQLDLINDTEQDFEVSLPEGMTDLDAVNTVTVAFDASGLKSTSLSLRNFQIVNMPDGYTAHAETQSLRVNVIGSRSAIESITANDFIARVDMADISLHNGQMEVPVSIYAPTKGLVWAIGDYSITVTVRQR